MRQFTAAILVAAMMASPVGTPVAAVAQQPQVATFKISSDTVLTNVVVRDKKTGAVIKGLKESDFTIFEDKKPQHLISFDYQNVDEAVQLAERNTVSGVSTTKKKSIADLISRQARGVEGSPPDRPLLRPQQHAAGGHHPRR
jgi:hypothetical protein